MTSTGDDAAALPLRPLQLGALIAGLAGLALCVLGYVLGLAGAVPPRKVFFSYLFAYSFVLGLGLGGMAIWMLHNLTGGAWGGVIRRELEAATRTVPLLAVLFVPVLLGMAQLYVWVDPSQIPLPPGSEVERHVRELLDIKRPYLNVPFFVARAVLYFAVWAGIAWRLGRWAEQIDRTADPEAARRMQGFSGRALVLFGLAVTFAAFDWLMSLEPTWYSTIFGVLVLVGELVPGMALAVGVAAWLAPRTAWGRAVAAEVWNDLGNLMLATVMLWAYISFSQLLLVWSGNLPEEISWYVIRSQGGWEYVAGFLALFYFAVPFLLLLSRQVKRRPGRLLRVAVLLVLVSLVQQFWLVNPVYCRLTAPPEEPNPLCVHWLDLAALVGLGGLWLAAFLWELDKRPLTPPPDPLVQEEPHYA